MNNEEQIFNDKIQAIFLAHQQKNFNHLLTLAKNFISDYENHIFGYKAIAVAYNELNNLNNALCFAKKSIEINNNDDEALSNLSIILLKIINNEISFTKRNKTPNDDFLKQLKFIEKLLRRAIKINYKNADIYNNLACVLLVLKRFDEAEVFAKKAIVLNNNKSIYYDTLAIVFAKKKDYINADFFVRKAISFNENNPEYYYHLGVILNKNKQKISAVESFQKSVDLAPNDYSYLLDFAQILRSIGENNKAFMYSQKLLELKQQQNIKPSFFELSLPISIYPYTSNSDAQTMGELAKNLAKKTTLSADKIYQHKPPKFSPKKLKIGFVSGDLKYHPVTFFLLSMLHFLKYKQINLDFYAYSTCPKKELDNTTEQIKKYFIKWQDVIDFSDEELAKTINKDNIHILFDLSGYTKYNRLEMFAYQPAPIQVTWIGWLATTGIAGMNYFLADKYCVPDEKSEQQFSEKVYKLPHIWECLTPPENSISNDNSPPPKIKNIYNDLLEKNMFVLGSFNNPNKVSKQCLDLWCKVLNKIHNSCLIWLRGDFENNEIKQYFLNEFQSRNVNINKVLLLGNNQRSEYISSLPFVDLIMDTFPFTGMTTTAEALSMGTPTLTYICSDLMCAKFSAACLNAVGNGLENLICYTQDEFINKAIYYANNRAELNLLKTNLRHKTLLSPLCDADLFADNFNIAMQKLWDDFLSSN